MMTESKQSGFILPTVLLISIAMIAIGLSLVQTTSSIRLSLTSSYINRLAAEAADSGITYANYCIGKNGSQQWSDASPLKPSTLCDGTAGTGYSKYLLTTGSYNVGFSVGAATSAQVQSSTATVTTYLGAAVADGTGTVLTTTPLTEKQTLSKSAIKAAASVGGPGKTCAILTGKAYCVGQNDSSTTPSRAGQIGNGTTTTVTKLTPVDTSGVMNGATITQLAAGNSNVCALSSVGTVYCWGQNTYGQLGDGTTTERDSPVKVAGVLAGVNVTTIGAADNTMCAIANTKIYCWGDNSSGTGGWGASPTQSSTPIAVSTANLGTNYSASDLAREDSESITACAIVSGSAYCWGDNTTGAVGANTATASYNVPTAVYTGGALSGKTIASISLDGYDGQTTAINTHVCAVASDNQAYCWGDNKYGQLGNGSTTSSTAPVLVTGLSGKTVIDVAAGVLHTCVLAASSGTNTVYCMGSNVYGQQGNNQTMSLSVKNTSPTAIVDANGVATGKTVTSVSGGASRACAIADYSTICWGLNSSYQLGDGTSTNRNVPVLSSYLQPAITGYLF